MKRFGPVVYNLYGSTEIAYATIATPEDLKAAPGTVGKVVHGAVVKLSTTMAWRSRPERPAGVRRQRDPVRGLHRRRRQGADRRPVSSGDVGHFDKDGRLFIDGRDDDMIISGGENVFPAEVEELLAAHEAMSRGRGDRRRRREVRPATEGVRRVPQARQEARARTRSRATSRTTWPTTRCRVRSCSRRAAAQPDRQGAQEGSEVSDAAAFRAEFPVLDRVAYLNAGTRGRPRSRSRRRACAGGT